MLVLTALYVPGDRPERFDRAERSGADAVIVDLEDAVAPAHKRAARANVVSWLAEPHSCRTEVRVDPREGDADLRALAAAVHPPDVVRLPKVQTVSDVRRVLAMIPSGSTLTCLLESALGVQEAYPIARCDPRVGAIALGETDLATDLGTDGEEALAFVRSRVVLAARAAGLPAPLMSVYPHVSDLAGLAVSCAVGRRLGLVGRAVVHPSQVPVVVEAFAPAEGEVQAAREVLAALEVAGAADVGVVALADGRMVDPAMAGRARAVLEVAEAVGRHRRG